MRPDSHAQKEIKHFFELNFNTTKLYCLNSIKILANQEIYTLNHLT